MDSVEHQFTHHAFVGFFSRMNPHVDEELVASVEGFVAPHTAGPETRKLLPFTLVDVNLLDVPHQLLLAAVSGAAVDPVTQLLLLVHRRVPSHGCVQLRGVQRRLGAVLTAAIVAVEGLANMKQLPLLAVHLKRFPLTRQEIVCRLLFDGEILVLYFSLLLRRFVVGIRKRRGRGEKQRWGGGGGGDGGRGGAERGRRGTAGEHVGQREGGLRVTSEPLGVFRVCVCRDGKVLHGLFYVGSIRLAAEQGAEVPPQGGQGQGRPGQTAQTTRLHRRLAEATWRQWRLRVLGIFEHAPKTRESQLDVWRPEVGGPHPGPRALTPTKRSPQ